MLLFYFLFSHFTFVSNLQMRQQNSDKPRGSAFSLSSILQFVVFILAVIILQIPMLYVAGSETQYSQQQHPLDSIFDTPKYKKLKDTISSPKQKYINLQGDKQSGVMSFIQNYAIQMKDKKQIVVREYSDDEFESIYAVFRLAKSMIENKINIEQDHPKVFILFCFSGQIPKSEIHQIAVNPQDRIIAVTSGSQKIKGFKNVQFPPVKISQLKKQLISKMNFDEPTVNILLKHYESVPNIFQNLNNQEFSISQHLGNQYSEISFLDQASQQILEDLCKNGQANGDEDSLAGVGVILQNGRYYWKSENTQLNYELQEKVQCEGGVATDDILTAYEDLEDDSEESNTEETNLKGEQDNGEEEQNQENEEEQTQKAEQEKEEEQEEKSEKKPKKKSKKSKQSKQQQANNDEDGNIAEDDDAQPKKSKKSKKSKKAKQDDQDKDAQDDKKPKKNKKSKKQSKSEQLELNSEESQQKSGQSNEGNDDRKDDKKEKKKDKKKDKKKEEEKEQKEQKNKKQKKNKKKQKEDDEDKKKKEKKKNKGNKEKDQ